VVSMSREQNYKITNTTDKMQFMQDNGQQRRFKPGQTKITESKPDGRKTWYELEVLNPELEDMETSADIKDSEESNESEEDSSDE